MSRTFSWFLTLRGRLVLLVCIATLPAMLFTFYAANNERSAAAKRMEEEARHLAVLASREHRAQFEGAHNLLVQLGEMLRRQGDGAPLTQNPEFLPALLAGFPQFANIGVLSAQGDVLGSAYPIEHPASWRDNPAFARALKSNEVETGQYVVGLIVGRPVVQLAYAVRGASGAVRSVLFVALDLQWLDRLAQQVKLPPDYMLIIADRDARVLAHGGELSNESLATGARLGGARELSGGTSTLLKLSEGGPRRLFVGEPMEGVPGVTVLAGLPFERVATEADFAFFRTLGALALLTLFTVGAALFAADVSVLRSLRGLSRAARHFGEGELQTRARVSRGGGEMRELAQAFNSMAGALEARHRESLAVQDQLRALSQRLQLSREHEAGRIARELHDELGQHLTGLKMDISWLGGKLPADHPELARKAEGMKKLVDTAVKSVRRIASELRPLVLDDLGLVAGLEWLVQDFSRRTGIEVALDMDIGDAAPAEAQASALFRIVQESLTNVARHAGASRVRVTLTHAGGRLLLAVQDNGKGIAAGAAKAGSFGLLGIRERAIMLGGEASVAGQPGEGTRVEVSLPYPAPAEAAR